jgi:hypothetical protein
MNPHLSVMPAESGSTDDLVLGAGGRVPTSTSTGTMTVLPTVEREPRRRRWRAAAKRLAVAALPLAEVYDPPRRGLFETGISQILVTVDDLIDDSLLFEPESLLVIAPDRPTLWFPGPLPILASRRPYVSPTWDLLDEDE